MLPEQFIRLMASLRVLKETYPSAIVNVSSIRLCRLRLSQYRVHRYVISAAQENDYEGRIDRNQFEDAYT